MPGFVCALDTSADDTIKLYDTKANNPAGLALESNIAFPFFDPNAPSGTPIGVGFDFLNYNRGGLIGLFRNGGEVVLYDDLRDTAVAGNSNPVDFAASAAYAVNNPVYANQNNGKVTSDLDTDRKQVGIIEKVIGTGATMSLKVRLAGALA